MTTLPDPNNPQVGDRFASGSGETFTVRYVDNHEVFVEYDSDGSETSWSLGWIAYRCTPVPPPTPGPDELWVPIRGGVAMPLAASMQRVVDCYPDDIIVRYVKADPQ